MTSVARVARVFVSAALFAAPGVLFMAPVALALDGTPAPALAPILPGGDPFGNPQQAFRRGVEALRSGDTAQSVPALKYAAENGHPLAQWKLGKMYADGDGVPHDDYKAFQYFSKIVDDFDEDDGGQRELAVVSKAFVAVGVYSLKGIPSRLKPDASRALDMFRFAATNFGDPDAQYNLARMMLDGVGVTKNPPQAARWLSLAAEKRHVASQALLGHLLFNGDKGVAPQRARGLMWLQMAQQNCDPGRDKWIVDAYTTAMAGASDLDRDASRLYAERFLRRGD
jgi:hypothetical protein